MDSKGRLAIPTRFREVLERRGEDCLVVTNHDSCLWVYAKKDWLIIEEKAIELPEFDQDVNTYLRYFISGAKECPLKQNRITIPPDLREIAGLDREVMLVGQLKRFEIWDKDRWEEAFQRAKEHFPKASQSLREFGI
ncbi:MAG: division/cell wall cluster transcriptional repressor MraZ [Deltaproteobacteria bacterium]|nr:division/cell wall cluster transcriptional repressor MraZ [Deltaproteobacteria bacterium]MBW1929795.1 division/cell wall cluster transcriptional repressor MraZ [Deltaproteobacteria bacterium]MBW2024441.1 division/cell wall cluster transcriptional repressor MraZ [Deltaproteobacteria bacterium]